MIRIIKEGTRKVVTCEECGCKFSYEGEDIESKPTVQYDCDGNNILGNQLYVSCPQCKSEVEL